MIVYTQSHNISDAPFDLKPVERKDLLAVAALEQQCYEDRNPVTGYLGTLLPTHHRQSVMEKGGTVIGAYDANGTLVGQQLGCFIDDTNFDFFSTDFHALNYDLCADPK